MKKGVFSSENRIVALVALEFSVYLAKTNVPAQEFTKGMLEANPNVIYATLPIMPRAYFLTLSYKF